MSVLISQNYSEEETSLLVPEIKVETIGNPTPSAYPSSRRRLSAPLLKLRRKKSSNAKHFLHQ
ncbi:MAG: hypothetical protein ACI837_002059 [Crocinitomicaceae bacterium]